jgi:hypothetical protein
MRTKKATWAVGKRRLLALANLLYNMKPNRFDYTRWVGGNWGGKPELSCGTSACALGWATTMPPLRKLGLRLRKTQFDEPWVALSGYRTLHLNLIDTSIRNASVVFGISTEDAEELFLDVRAGGGVAPSAKFVAASIRRFVKRRDKELSK